MEGSGGNIEWEIDVLESSDEETASNDLNQDQNDNANAPARIPRYEEAQNIDDELEWQFKSQLAKRNNKTSNQVTELLKKSVIAPGFEQLKSVPNPFVSRRALQKERQKEREKTKGPAWYNIPVQEVTEDVKNDLDLLRMRSVLDPRHHYKKNDITHIPKFFQVGTVVEGPADFYNGRLTKSERKKSLVSELMSDVEARATQKKNYQRILARQNRQKNHPKRLNTNSKKGSKKKKSTT